MSDVLPFPQQRASKAASAFPPLLTQNEIDAQALPQKRRSLAGFLWVSIKTVLMILGILVVLGFLMGG